MTLAFVNMRRPVAIKFLILFLLIGYSTGNMVSADPPKPGGAFIEKYCTECHDADSKKGGLDLTALN